MKSLGIIFHGLLIKGASSRIHTLVARLHGYLIRAILIFLLLLIVEEATLHGMAVVNYCLHRVILFISADQRIDLVFICLILDYLNLVMRRGKIGCVMSLLTRLFEIAHNLLLTIVRIGNTTLILCFDDVCRPFRGALLLGSLLLSTIVRMVNLSISILLPIFVVRIVFLTFQICLIRLHVSCNMMRLQMVLILHHKHVVVCYQVVSLIRNGVIELIVIIIIALVILLSRFENVFDLGFQFQLFLQLLLFVLVIHYLLIFDKLLSFIFLPNCFINNVPFI